jgi:hypothetical protein
VSDDQRGDSAAVLGFGEAERLASGDDQGMQDSSGFQEAKDLALGANLAARTQVALRASSTKK